MSLPRFDHVTLEEVVREADSRLRNVLHLDPTDPDPIEDWIERTNRARDDAREAYRLSLVAAGGMDDIRVGDLLNITVATGASRNRRMINCLVLGRSIGYHYGERGRPLDCLDVRLYRAKPGGWHATDSIPVKKIVYAERVEMPAWVREDIENRRP